ncbi:PEP-CTERM sorting domain-containing protein [Rivularia sp. PCC 7116]|uniref:PEP-CTERM sorting domain-containing protein n=1 Tax=Rivularia sp. PCC 7116 TaxID=373994 RepID=UPI0012F81A30|nr:PEP-CTERM sorting domain-containing protein [Rivularia sp. PCC 7116]
MTASTSFILLMLSGMFAASRANAVSVTSSNGVATGINDLNVYGQKYDVDFTYGTFADVFGNPFAPVWTPPTLSANVRPNVANPPIQQATDAVVAELNSDLSNQVADGNLLTPKNYFISGGLRNDINDADELQIFYGQLNSQGEWMSNNLTCTYNPSKTSLTLPFCLNSVASLEPTFNLLNPSNSKVMFAKYNTKPAPEPITILGTVVAGGMGVAIKRKQKNKTAA